MWLLPGTALGGLSITALCLYFLYLLDAQYHGVSVAPSIPSTTTIATQDGPSTQGQQPSHPSDRIDLGAAVLHPQDHVHRAPKTIRLTWNVTQELRSPDGVAKSVYLINGTVFMSSCRSLIHAAVDGD
jgi:hypothetical protein